MQWLYLIKLNGKWAASVFITIISMIVGMVTQNTAEEFACFQLLLWFNLNCYSPVNQDASHRGTSCYYTSKVHSFHMCGIPTLVKSAHVRFL